MNLTNLLDELGIKWFPAGHRHVTAGWIGVDCPRCSPDTEKAKLGINLNGLFSSCWSCGSIPLAVALAELADKPVLHVNGALAGIGYEKQPETPIQRGKLVLPKGVGPLLPVHKRYLKGRGFDPGYLASFWGVKGIGLAAHLAWRIFIPINYRGKIVSWTTRSLCDDGLRYINAKPEQEVMRAKDLLLGQDHCRHAVVVCEGPLDCIRIGPGAVSTFGLGYSQAQFNKISSFPLRVVAFDSDNTAQERARELCENLSSFPGKTVRVVVDGKDPGSSSQKEINLLRKEFLE